MSRNIFQVFTTNPSAILQGTDLMYLGKSPYGPASDSAILASDIFPTAVPPVANTIAIYADATGTKLSTTSLTVVGGTTITGLTALTTTALTVTGLTASRIVQSDAAKLLVSVATIASFVVGTANRITSTDNGVGGTTLNIAATYVGQNSITTLGTITTGVWNGTVLLPLFGGTGVASPTIHTLPIAQGAGVFNFVALTNGQLLIGSTGLDPVAAGITAGANISVTNAAGSITIAGTGAASFSWIEVVGAAQVIAVNKGYIANNAGVLAFSLPAVSAVGDEFRIVGKGAGGWSVSQAAGQQMIIGATATTVGVGGSLASTNSKDAVVFVCTVANTTWTAWAGPEGNITVT